MEEVQNQNVNNSTSPTLRFIGFNEKWKALKLGLICSKIGSGKTPKGGEKIYLDKGIPFIRSQNIRDNQLLLDETCISEDLHRQMRSSIVLSNDVLLNITGASIGRSCVVPQDFTEGNVNQHVSIIRLKTNEPKFLQAFIASPQGQKLIYQSQTGSGREGLNFESIKKFKIFFPSLEEQQKVASFLTTVDDKINQLNRKRDLLEQYKKGVMQKLFNQELRFKDDNGNDYPEWKVKKLGDVATFFSGGTPTSSNRSFYSGKIPFIGSGNISAEVVDQYITEEALQNSSSKIVEVGDLLYALYGATSGEVAISKINGAINQAVLCIRTSQNIEFLQQFLQTQKAKITSKYLQGGQGNLSAKIVRDLKIAFPSLEEQTKIANFLSATDKKIEQVQTQIDNTTSFKKGLLQQMFI